MSVFVDSSKLLEIEKYHKFGIIRGVTSNPSIMFKDGVKGMSGVKTRSIEIAKLVDPLPVSVEVLSNEKQEMLDQAREFASWAPNINVKITIHGPNGELENVEVIHQLETQHDVRVNVTAMMSVQQCYIAAMAGASYVSIFGGRVNNMGYDSRKEVTMLRKVLDDFNLKAKIIVGSVREVLNIIEWLHAGAHIVTSPPNLIEGMIVHPYTKETVQMFLNDAVKINNN